MDGWVGVTAGEIGGVPLVESGAPFIDVFDLGEGFADEQMLGMEGGVFDAELSHVDAGTAGSVELFGKAEVLEHDVALLEERGRRWKGLASGQSPALREDPGVADRAAGDGDAIDAGLVDHVEAVLRGKQVAAAEDRPSRPQVALHFGQEFPAAIADVSLDDGAAVYGDGGDTEGEGTFDDFNEVVTTFF